MQLIAPKELERKGVTYSRVHRWRLEKEGKFPRRVPLSEKKYAYVESEIDQWVRSRIAARDAALQAS